ncbi:AraC family transcriptional regulator [Hymenobacter sp. H14-R3]|uniref:helix-turn-helix domain-containing protein n=1 Tax=Hymenobacter sp. H14-R3 TaxID=3046308 RepID=UPI0024BAEDE0|nr:AraC family transcriptional regulator [Hymenobacter sp. H14-R3]MDJ0366451.1 AraC family transcriptional regulator [Hymenobacter sp. H14-R3]
MIIERKTFSYRDKVLIEKVLISTPYRYEAIFHNEGCFIQIRGAGTKLLSPADNLLIENQEAVLMKCGTYFLDFIHKIAGDTMEVLAIHLYPDILRQIYSTELPALLEKRAYMGQSTIIANEIIISRYVESLEFYFQNPALVNDDLLELKIKELVLLLVQTKNAASILELVTDLYSSRTLNLKNIIDLHKHSNLSLEELAALCHLSLSAFKRAFKKMYADNPTHYFIREKLKKAKELLTLSDLAIGEIAYEAGFNDPLYFTRLFKKREGITPTAFRATHALPSLEGNAAGAP